MAVYPRFIAQHHNISQGQALHLQVTAARADQARPASNRSPDWASLTLMAQISSRRRENISVNPSGMCCTTRMVPGKVLGQLRQQVLQGLRAAGGDADGDDPRGALLGIRVPLSRPALKTAEAAGRLEFPGSGRQL